ncbi:hypothetical protein CEK28_05815 [Xenophilus sp. AP218F]|nr:hypothetical protein [Chromobacterium sp. ASV5]OWY40243.1 hypothetical protein CEK28_05815 [Xenophilus sp. AP218F]
MKLKLILAGLLAAGAAHAADLPFQPKPTGQAIVINGKTYYKPGAGSGASSFGLSAKRSAGGGAPTLKRGDVLQPARQFEPAKASGVVLVQLAAPQQEAALARDYGLKARYRTQSVVVFDTPPQAELLSLQQRLSADKRVKLAQLELASDKEQAE